MKTILIEKRFWMIQLSLFLLNEDTYNRCLNVVRK